MTLRAVPACDADRLRQLAEFRLQQGQTKLPSDLSEHEALRLTHELQVHQIELEMQCEELNMDRERLRLAASVFEHTFEGIIITDAQRKIIEVNPAFTRITGFSRLEVLGHSPRRFSADPSNWQLHHEINAVLIEHGAWRGELWNRNKHGEQYPIMLSITSVRNDIGTVINYIGVFSDISILKRHEAELDQIAHFDPLTGMPNRRLLSDRLQQAVARSQRRHIPMAVCYLDLDGFKQVNDLYGHATGDQLLVGVTQRLQQVLRVDDTLARLGGDEFVLLLSDLASTEECEQILARVLAAVCIPTHCGDIEVHISASVGVTLFPQDNVGADALIRHADQAMYLAKQSGKNRFKFYDHRADLLAMARNAAIQRLALALECNEFVLHYQPQVNLLTGAVTGAEALIRWQHPERGLLLPADFLHDILASELEIPVGEWIISEALRQMSLWQDQSVHLPVSVNIAAMHFMHPAFCERLRYVLDQYPQISPSNLGLEILESTALDDLPKAIEAMQQCLAIGVHFALDDFGTGYSSLAYFRRLPIDVLKIDQSFVRNMLSDADNLNIVEGVVRIANAFDRPVIAEGVETLEHGALLLQIGCHLSQGYGIAMPMPASDIPDWIECWQAQKVWLTLGQFVPRQV
ncbi:bifunctional diguanylate cyclase/phosphodiesterase [Chitinibacter sp. GC72]|uniref:putative bifunctional diguanylate cyclase/phosphodiesterase n=1 Tax=Chitinibacter sp. GC72 TaxID=1526917 RepID=UPI0012F72C64|nr:EAL domain-containing protein [Chitinibacter sp. GC72]